MAVMLRKGVAINLIRTRRRGTLPARRMLIE